MKEPGEDPQELRRRDAVIAGHVGDVNTARAATHDDDPRVRASALGALDRMGALADGELQDALGDPSPKVRLRAAALTVGRTKVTPALLLDDPSDEVVETAEAAVAALGAIGHPEGLDAILAATTDRAAVRRRAVLALAPFDGPEVEAAIHRASQDRDWQTRDAAELLANPD